MDDSNTISRYEKILLVGAPGSSGSIQRHAQCGVLILFCSAHTLAVLLFCFAFLRAVRLRRISKPKLNFENTGTNSEPTDYESIA